MTRARQNQIRQKRKNNPLSEHQKQTAFLRQCLVYDDTGERHELEESITQLQRNERCVRRAVWVMALLVALAFAGLCYYAVALAERSPDVSGFMTQYTATKLLCALALGSLVCMVAFTGLGMVYRKELDKRRERCRRLAAKLLESRLGNPRVLEGASAEISPAASRT